MLDLSTMNFVAELHPQTISLRNLGADKSKVFENFCIWRGGRLIIFKFFFLKQNSAGNILLGYLVNNFEGQ